MKIEEMNKKNINKLDSFFDEFFDKRNKKEK
jgi:hypothetical protein